MRAATTSTWEFSPQQWEAVTSADRHVLVSAGAGTGKTRTVVGRILYLLGVGLTPPASAAAKSPAGDVRCSLRDIAAITFTNAAAADLKKKLRDALLAAGRRDIAYEIDLSRIGTIHSFCMELLREFALHAGTNPREQIVDASTLTTIRSDVVRETILEDLDAVELPNINTLLARFSVQDIRNSLDRLLLDSERVRRISAGKNIPAPERAILDMALAANEKLEARLADMEMIDFERIIVRARNLLRDSSQIRSVLRRRIHTLIIDEFQDVDPVQKEIAYLLADPASERTDTTRLMLVGDAKQSIYRFRRADVRVWNEVTDDFEKKGWGRICSTTRSFRCSRQILGFVDSTIGKALDTSVHPDGRQSFEVPFQALSTGVPEQDKGPPIEMLLITAEDDGKERKQGERTKLEVNAVADRAKVLHEEGYSWGEMAVVLRRWTMAREYQKALEAVGAPAYPLRTAGFYEQREVLDIQLALETICDPMDDRVLVGFLRSPFVGVSDETLLRLRHACHGPMWESIETFSKSSCLVDAEAERLTRGISILNRYTSKRDRVPTHELLEDLLFDTGYLAHLHLLGPDKDKAASNVMRLLREARGASRMRTTQFLEFLKQCRASKSEISDERIARKDAITITTTHSAKGLEWKVVFWGELGADLRLKDSGKILLGRDSIALRDSEAESQSTQYDELQSLDALEGLAEVKRLWYVAATRAIERLVLCGVSEARIGAGKAARTEDYILAGLEDVEAVDGSSFGYQNSDGERFEGVVRVVSPALAADPEWPPVLPEPRSPDSLPGALEPRQIRAGRPKHSATEHLTYSACPRRHWFKYTAGIREPALEPGQYDSLISAVARGQIVHDVLERLREESELDEILDDAIRKNDADAPNPGTRRGIEYRDHLRDEIERVANHPEYRAIADLPGARTEMSFLYIAGEDEYYEGSFDLAAPEGEALALLDVKTSQCDTEAVNRKAIQYRPQRDVYLAAAEGVGGMEAGRFAFQFSRAQHQVSDTVDSETRDQAARSMEQITSGIEAGDRATTNNGNECRFCGYEKVGLCGGASQKG